MAGAWSEINFGGIFGSFAEQLFSPTMLRGGVAGLAG